MHPPKCLQFLTSGQRTCIHPHCHFLVAYMPTSSCKVFLMHFHYHLVNNAFQGFADFVILQFGYCSSLLLQECCCCPKPITCWKVAYELSSEREHSTMYDNSWSLQDCTCLFPSIHAMLPQTCMQTKHFCTSLSFTGSLQISPKSDICFPTHAMEITF